MRALLIATVLALGVSGCRAGSEAGSSGAAPAPGATSAAGVAVAPPPAATSPAGAAAPAYRTVGARDVPTTTQGLALYGDHVAYALAERRLVWTDWRTGAGRTVYTTTYGSLFLLTVSGRYAEAVDMRPSGAGGDAPDSPHRYVQLDLQDGSIRLVEPLPPGAQLIGELNDVRIEAVGLPYHQRHDLVEVPQVPDPRLRHAITTNGLVVQASFDGRHRVVWTQRPPDGHLDGHEVLTRDLLRPDQAPVVLAQSSTLPVSYPVVGRGFVGWVRGGHLRLVSTVGGATARLPDHLATTTAPAADRHRVAVVVSHDGHDRLVVLRVG